MSEHISLESPKLAALHQALQQGQSGALAAFWKDVEVLHSPLIEPIEE